MNSREQLSPVLKHTNMKSRITIEVDFERDNQPVILATIKHSDDVRDKLLRSFIEALGGTSNWCRIDLDHYNVDTLQPERNYACWRIAPITPPALQWQASHMKEMGDAWGKDNPLAVPIGDTKTT